MEDIKRARNSEHAEEEVRLIKRVGELRKKDKFEWRKTQTRITYGHKNSVGKHQGRKERFPA